MDTLTLDDVDVANKKVLMRVDFNVPLDKAGNITDDTRISAALPSIQKILSQNGKLILMSHLGRPKGKMAELSLRPCAERLSLLLKRPVLMAKDCIGPEVTAQVAAMKPGDVLLLENVRFYDAEEKPEKDPSFAEQLAKLGDVYVNDAFGTAHRAHSSTATIAKFFPNRAVAGYLLEKEIAFLGDHILHPRHPFFAIIGGAKVSTKIGVIRSLLAKCDALFLGGAMAYIFLKAKGISIGDSPCEDTMLETAQSIIKECDERKVALFFPQDIVAANAFSNEADSKIFSCQEGIAPGFQGMDIGEKTIRQWSEELKKAKVILRKYLLYRWKCGRDARVIGDISGLV